ncbi:Esterase/lipase/thioesterase [Serendipita sp. 399]|nr:Esterase/lipase/thioesterase [Serendipita sp. 399]
MIRILIVLALAATQVIGHGYVPQIQIGSNWYAGWDVTRDPYASPPPLRPVRRTPNDSGFISDPTSSRITCSIGNEYLPAGGTLTIAAGAKLSIHWNTWPDASWVTMGVPVMNYMAKCSGSCSTFRGDSGSPWFKISQDVYSGGKWGNQRLVASNFTATVTIPSKLAAGDYLLRHENLALHGASSPGGAQFYPVCIHLKVTGGGSASPSGLAFPGAYKANDPGILFNPYQGDAANQKYVAPGGPVYQF